METSNLLEYSAEQLSLLIDSIDRSINDQRALTVMVDLMIDGAEDIPEQIEIRLRKQIAERTKKIDDLYGLRVAIMNAHQIVLRRDKVTQG